MQLVKKVGLMGSSAVVLSVATIAHFNDTVSDEQIGQIRNGLELAALTLMPYMISAAVAAITAISVTSLLPFLQLRRSIDLIQARLQAMAAGDLSTPAGSPKQSPPLNQVVSELNNTVSTLGHTVAEWKVINRQQWDILQAIRQAAADNDNAGVLAQVGVMERNWTKIAQLEERLIT